MRPHTISWSRSRGAVPYFRIFIDAATLKLSASGNPVSCAVSYFRIFIDAATLKPQRRPHRRPPEQAEFPHLYRCGHIEATRRRDRSSRNEVDFRIFIDAATLKPAGSGAPNSQTLDFRIFIDAATLKPPHPPTLPPMREANFRIFIDAATLKPNMSARDVFSYL